jgi:hypothetical protein
MPQNCLPDQHDLLVIIDCEKKFKKKPIAAFDYRLLSCPLNR